MKRLDKLFDLYMIIFFGLVLSTNFYFIYTRKINVLYIVPAIILFIGILYIARKVNTPNFGLYLFLFAFLNKMIMILVVSTPPISDFEVMVNAGELFARGDYSFKEWQYFDSWAYQSTFAVYQGLIFKIFGTNIMVLKVINCLYIALTTWLVYKIGSLLFDEFVGKVAGLIHSVYIPLFFFAPVLTNQHIATLFYYLAIYCIVKKGAHPYRKWILAGVLLAIGNTLRPIGIIFIAGLLILSIMDIIHHHFNKETIIKQLKRFSICLVTYFVIFYSISSLFIAAGITDTGLKNNNPYWKFVTGFNEKTSGRFSIEDAQMLYGTEINEELFEKEKEMIRSRVFIPPYRFVKLMINKVRYMWGDFEAGVFTFPHLIGKDIKIIFDFDTMFRQVQEFEKMFYIIIIGLVFYGLIRNFKPTKSKYVRLLYYIITLYTGIHFLVEISFRYKYVVMGIVFILAGYGSKVLLGSIPRFKEKEV